MLLGRFVHFQCVSAGGPHHLPMRHTFYVRSDFSNPASSQSDHLLRRLDSESSGNRDKLKLIVT